MKQPCHYLLKRGTQQDQEAVDNICQDFADDFVPDVFDDWINLDKGGLYILEASETGQAVACCALYFITPDLAWLAGMRVRRGHQKLGAGFYMTQELVNLAKKLGASQVSMMTHVHNTPAQKLSAKLGFQVQFCWKIFYTIDIHERVLGHSPVGGPGTVTCLSRGKLPQEMLLTSRMFFLPGFNFVQASLEGMLQDSPGDRMILQVDHHMMVLGESAEREDGQSMFLINRILQIKDLEQVQESFKRLFAYLSDAGYQGLGLAMEAEDWENVKAYLPPVLTDEMGGYYYYLSLGL